ncbi:SH3 domain-containing protein [Streptomyces sp. NPDC002577]
MAGAVGAFGLVLGAASTASAATYSVVADVNVRSGPSTSYPIVAKLASGAQVAISCQTPGETITGPLGTSNIWDRIGSDRYVTDTYVRTGSDGYVAPRC